MNLKEFRSIFDNCDVSTEFIILKSNLEKTIEYIKNHFHFDILKNITAQPLDNKTTELYYELYSTDDDETVYLKIQVKETAESIKNLYENAEELEANISNNTNIKFTI